MKSILAITILALCGGSIAAAADLKVLSTVAMKPFLHEALPAHERVSADRVRVEYATAAEMKARIEKGEAFDVAIVTAAGVEDLVKQGKIDAAAHAPLARSGVGVAVKRNAPKPDMGDAEAFKRALLGASAIVFAETGATSGIMKKAIAQLQLDAQVSGKVRTTSTAVPEATVAAGQGALGFTQVSEILESDAVDLVGPLPPAVQTYTTFSAGVSTSAASSEAAIRLLRTLRSDESAKILKAKGMEAMAR